ncbi:hypothetical protein EX30DRAFT_273533 [Ascodesmis nigricans]|uniref:Dedicator of cytokinesis protein 1 n=1 Tax=Ascodesmis nigricans TaxID=341454 RepID=A0A4S2MXC2_9PEZI|nr:hypothetical protein EX30DRAFT_273533 [Ascodesmis nigricans]
MPWTPLPRIAFAIAIHPFDPTTRDDLPLELGDELYIIEQCCDGAWFRGYLVAPPSLLSGLTSTKGATLEARVFTGVFPAACVHVREYLSANVGAAGTEDRSPTRASMLPEFQFEDDNNNDDDDDDDGTATERNIRRSRHRSVRNSLIRSHQQQRRETSTGERIRPPAPVPMLKVGDETATHDGEPLVDEIASCLREWHAANLHELLLGKKYTVLDEVSMLVQQLDLSRRQFLNNVLTQAEVAKTREETVWRLVRGNKLLSREIIVRDPASGRILTSEDSSVEVATLQCVMSLLDEPPKSKADEATKLHHLLLEHKAHVGSSKDPVTVVFYLSTKDHVPVSESYAVELNSRKTLMEAGQMAGKMQALMTDISSRDAADLFLVARVYTNVTVVSNSPSKQQNSHADPINGNINGSGVVGGTLKGNAIRAASRMMGNNSSTSNYQSNWSTNGNNGGSGGAPSANGSAERKLKGRVSVLFNRPKTSGKDEQKQGRSPSSAENRPPSAAASLPSSPINENDQQQHVQFQNLEQPTEQARQKKLILKKALGVGVLDVGRFVLQDQGTEQIMQIHIPGNQHNHDKNSSKHSHDLPTLDWDRIAKEVIEARAGKSGIEEPVHHSHRSTISDLRQLTEKAPKIDRLHLTLKPYTANDADELIKSMPTTLSHATVTPKIGFSGAPTKPRNDIYITVTSAMFPKHASFGHPRNGISPLPSVSQFAHLQVTMEVRKQHGERIADCIFPSSHGSGQTVWKSAVVGRDETWSQTLRLALKDEDVQLAHVYFTLSGVPNPPSAMAWFPLWDKGVFIKDGDRELVLNKYDDVTTSTEGYINSRFTLAGTETQPLATLKVRSYLCSTKFSQDDVLFSLIKWRDYDLRQISDILKKVVFVTETEIVKLLREVFDALFQILTEHASKSEIEDLVFNALVTVLGIVYDRRFNMGPIVEDYADNHFDYPFATACLLRSFTRLLHDPAHAENSVRLRATFKVGKHIFRFIVHARAKQVLKEANIGINGSQSFIRDLQGVFKLLEQLMRSSVPRLVGSQTIAVQHFHTWLPELVNVMSREDILLIAIDFMDSCAEVKGKLVLFKLVLIINYSRCGLFSQPEDRQALTVNTVRWLEPHWGKTNVVTQQWKEQVRLCCSILAEQVDELGEEVSDYIPKIVDSYRSIQLHGTRERRDSFSMLFPKTYPFPSKPISGDPIMFDEALAELSSILAAVSNIPTSLHLVLPEEDLAEFLMDALKVHMSILSCEAYPDNWLSVHIYQHKSTMRTLETLAGVLVESFLPHPDDADRFDMDLWQAFFSTLLRLVGSDALALETFPEQKRRAVWKIAGDVREHGADLLRRTWEAIGWETTQEEKQKFRLEKMGGYQVQYVPGLVAPIVELCLSVHEGLRSVAVEVLQSMVVSEWTLSQDLSVIEAEMIDTLDRLFKSKHLTESITQKLFIADLIELFKPLSLTPNDPLSKTVGNLLQTMDEFLDLLVAVHNTPLGEAYQIMDTLRLMEFLKDMRKEDMFIRYVHQLVNVQLQANNLVEAALSLKLHADLYTWDFNEKVPALEDPPFPEQTAFERREQLYLEMISYFEDGKSWDNALDTYHELAENYEHIVFEYGKLARCNRAMAKLQEEILNTERVEPKFYRVAYFGMGFPLGLRDRQFIVQAGPWEAPQSFADRMLMQHPEAQITETAVDGVEGQFIQIVPVIAEMNCEHPVFRKQRVPANVRQYLARKNTRAFSVYHDQPDVALDAWSEKTVFFTAETFPSILKRSEIIETAVIGVSPVDRAIEEVSRRTKELFELEKS